MILFSLFLPLSLFWNVCANDASSMVVLKVKRRFPLSVRLIISAVFTRIEFQLHQTLWVTDTRWIPVPELWPWVSGLVQNEPQPLEAMTLDALVVQGRSEVEWQSLLCRGAVGVSADESPQSRENKSSSEPCLLSRLCCMLHEGTGRALPHGTSRNPTGAKDVVLSQFGEQLILHTPIQYYLLTTVLTLVLRRDYLLTSGMIISMHTYLFVF